jgi:hypothetical protein
MSQEVLDALFEQGQAELSGDSLVINSSQKQSFKLIPAVKFIYLAQGEHDPHNLVGKIFTQDQLKHAKADVYMDSVIYKDVAYQVEVGFLGIGQAKKEEKVPEAEKINQSDNPTVAEDIDVKQLSDYLLKIL